MTTPEGEPTADYKLIREYFVANYLDGSEWGITSSTGANLADAVAEMFSSEHWRETWNDAILAEARRVSESAVTNRDGP